MRSFAFATALCVAGVANANFVQASIDQKFLGTWSPVNVSTVQAIIGPSVLMQAFTVAKNNQNGDYWMSGIVGQVFRIREDKMQYCFARVASSPFVVAESTSDKVKFCYEPGGRMHSHKKFRGELAVGCDAAQIVLQMHPDGILEFTFYMSPPIKHAWVLLKKRAPAPPIEYYKVSNIMGGCDPFKPPPPTLASSSPNEESIDELPSMCPAVNQKKQQFAALGSMMNSDMDAAIGGQCRQLGTFGSVIARNSINIRLQYKFPSAPCWPCKVKYTVVAEIPENQYITVGFKGMGYRFYEGMIPGSHKGQDRPCYFGMCTDELDKERSGDVMVTAYPGGGGCVRQQEMVNGTYVGTPKDVEGNPDISGAAVQRKNGRTELTFVVEQHVGKNAREIKSFYNAEQQSVRVMWAAGEVDGGGCTAKLMMHKDGHRGVSPLSWFDQHPQCLFGEDGDWSLDSGPLTV